MLELEHNAAQVAEDLQKIRLITLPRARKAALHKASYKFTRQMAAYIRSQGDGDWQKVHPLTKEWESHGKGWKKKKGFTGPYAGIANNIQYKVDASAMSSETHIGRTFDTVSDTMTKIFEAMHKRQTTVLTDAMKLRIAAAPERKPNGDGRYALSSKIKKLTTVARPVIKPVFSANKNLIDQVFNKSYLELFGKALK